MENKSWKDNNTLLRYQEDYASDKADYLKKKATYQKKLAGFNNAIKNNESETSSLMTKVANKLAGILDNITGGYGYKNNTYMPNLMKETDEDKIVQLIVDRFFLRGPGENMDVDRLKKIISCYEAAKTEIGNFFKTDGDYKRLTQLPAIKNKIYDSGRTDNSTGWADPDNHPYRAYTKAVNSWNEEHPLEAGGYAIWDSKNGKRKVTIVSIDEPNDRAKINTEKGATLYVPLKKLKPEITDDLRYN